MKHFFREKRKGGFSFVEAIIAVFVLTAGIVAVMPMLSNSLNVSFDSRSQSTAILLAQEGVELVQNIRDNNWVNKLDSFTNIDDRNGRIDKEAADRVKPGGYQLKMKDGFYLHTGSPDTRYFRKIIVSTNAGGGKKIVSMVVWDGVGNFPTNTSECNFKNRCAYTETVLLEWGKK